MTELIAQEEDLMLEQGMKITIIKNTVIVDAKKKKIAIVCEKCK